MITKEEFDKRIEEDMFFEDWEEQYRYDYDIVEYYCFNIVPNLLIVNGMKATIILQNAADDEQKKLIMLAKRLIINKYNNVKNNSKNDTNE